jgi:tRNA modification GTPase
MAELHTIGSPPLVSAVLSTVCRCGARLAEPGEFTLRAFLAGRVDLAQAEAVLGVIDARDPAQLQSALAQLAGGLSGPIEQLRDALVELVAHLEAGLDFVEEDIRFIEPPEIDSQLADAANLIARLITQLDSRGHRDSPPSAVLVGSPNVGKSSLFNALASDARALVAGESGTTRDYLTATLELDGIECRLVDTAGVDPGTHGDETHASGEISRASQQLASAQARFGDIRILCVDSTRSLNDSERRLLAANPRPETLVLLTKCDQPRRATVPCEAIETSAHSKAGLERLRSVLRKAVVELQPSDVSAQLTAQRCSGGLRAAGESLARAAQLNRARAGEELIGAELRLALFELSKVTGAVYTDDILDRIFTRFCIGK